MSPQLDDDETRALTPVEGVPLTSPIYKLAEQMDRNRAAMGTRLGGELDAHAERLDGHADRLHEHDRRLDRVEGADGTNGKIGNLRGDVAAIRKWIAAVAMVALTGAAGFIKNVFDAGKARGADRIRLEQVERTLQEVRADLAQTKAEAWRRYLPQRGSGESP